MVGAQFFRNSLVFDHSNFPVFRELFDDGCSHRVDVFLGLFFLLGVDGGELLSDVENLVIILGDSQPNSSPPLLDDVHQMSRRTIQSVLAVVDRIARCYVFLHFGRNAHHSRSLPGTHVPPVFVGNIAVRGHFIRMLLGQLIQLLIRFDGRDTEFFPLLVEQIQNVFAPLLQRNRDMLVDLDDVDDLWSHVFEVREKGVAVPYIEGTIDHSVPLVVVDLDYVDAFLFHLQIDLEALPPEVDLQPQQPDIVPWFQDIDFREQIFFPFSLNLDSFVDAGLGRQFPLDFDFVFLDLLEMVLGGFNNFNEWRREGGVPSVGA